MTSIDFLNKVHKSLDSQEYSLSYSPAKSKNYMLYCNGNFIGGLFDEELCFVYADSVSELLGQPEPVYCGYSSTAQHRMLVIPEEHWAKALKLLYAEKFFRRRCGSYGRYRKRRFLRHPASIRTGNQRWSGIIRNCPEVLRLYHFC